ncbi:hypothetical protein F5H01DRAFT_45747 [Linnemannia elongata]|nr:hypothetical protein F5H01DRAFT_45747 [Linnemannia elongata]
MAHSRVGKRGSHADRPPIPPTIYKRTRSSSFNVAASSQSTGNGKDTPPTANTRTRSGSSNVATNSTTTDNSTTSGINNTTFIIKDTTTAPNKRQRRARNKRSNSIVSNGSSKNTSASSAKKQNNSKQMETNGAQAPRANEDIESDDPADNSGDEFVDAGSGSEAEELEDFNDEDEDDEGTQESAPNTSGAPQARLINNRGLKKTVDYVWLIGKLVNTAMDLNQGKEKAQRKGKGKDEAISIAEQELEFVRQVDESSHGHAGNTQAAYKSTYRPYMVSLVIN